MCNRELRMHKEHQEEYQRLPAFNAPTATISYLKKQERK